MFSVNVVYARLMNLLDPEQVVAVARAAGITTPLEPLPSLALGTQEVTVLDMASAYATFAAGGLHIDPILVTRIEDPSGRVLFEAVPTIQKAMEPAIAEQVTAALTEVVRRGTGQQAKIGRPVAGKTGTTEGQYDAWFVGYTPEISAAVWVGFPQGDRPLESPHTPFTITGGTWPAQIWARFATGALSGIPYHDLPDADRGDLVAVSDRPLHRLPRRPPLPPGPRGHGLRQPRRRAHRPLPHPQPRRPRPPLARLRARGAGPRPGRGRGLAGGCRLPGHGGVGRRPGPRPRHRPHPVPRRRQPPRPRRRGGAHRGGPGARHRHPRRRRPGRRRRPPRPGGLRVRGPGRGGARAQPRQRRPPPRPGLVAEPRRPATPQGTITLRVNP